MERKVVTHKGGKNEISNPEVEGKGSGKASRARDPDVKQAPQQESCRSSLFTGVGSWPTPGHLGKEKGKVRPSDEMRERFKKDMESLATQVIRATHERKNILESLASIEYPWRNEKDAQSILTTIQEMIAAAGARDQRVISFCLRAMHEKEEGAAGLISAKLLRNLREDQIIFGSSSDSWFSIKQVYAEMEAIKKNKKGKMRAMFSEDVKGKGGLAPPRERTSKDNPQ